MATTTVPTLRQLFLDAVLRHKLGQQQIAVDDAWLDEHCLIVLEQVDGTHQRPAGQMVDNAHPLVGQLLALAEAHFDPPKTANGVKITDELLRRYIGGQVEIQNSFEKYLFRGEIASIEIERDEDSREPMLAFTLAWMAECVGYPAQPERWVLHDDLGHGIDLSVCIAAQLGDNRLMFTHSYTGEVAVLYPLGGSQLDPAKVEGLVLPQEVASC